MYILSPNPWSQKKSSSQKETHTQGEGRRPPIVSMGLFCLHNCSLLLICSRVSYWTRHNWPCTFAANEQIGLKRGWGMTEDDIRAPPGDTSLHTTVMLTCQKENEGEVSVKLISCPGHSLAPASTQKNNSDLAFWLDEHLAWWRRTWAPGTVEIKNGGQAAAAFFSPQNSKLMKPIPNRFLIPFPSFLFP